MIDSAQETMLRRLLRPLVRYLIGRGWGYIAMRDLLKEIYVAEAVTAHRATPADEPTDSLISMVTGVHRKEVRRLRELQASQAETAERNPMAGVNMAARVIGTWVSVGDFLDAAGDPLVLPLRAPEGQPSFETLMRTAKIDMRARTIIDELLRAGAIEQMPEDHFKLVQSAYLGAEPKEKMLFLSANVGDHLRSALHNLSGTEAPFLERALFHNAVSAPQLEAARPKLIEMADRLLRQANQHLTDASTIGTEADVQPRRRLRLGVYYYETDAEDRV
jgi:hypothetical protein